MTQSNEPNTSPALSPTTDAPPTGSCGLTDGKNAAAGLSQPTSTSSAGPISGLNKRWRRPTSARQLASQATAVATKLLNGELDLETARAYGTMTRSIAQMLSVEVTKARFLDKEPDMGLGEEVYEPPATPQTE